jgi:nucleotide-binding universal stress UspA family protein
MLPIKKIISPTDFSEPSNKGLEAALEMAEHFGAELVVIHVIAPLPVMGEASAIAGYHSPTVMEELNTETRKLMEKLIAEKISNRVPSRSHIVSGKPADEIVRLARQEESADLIVIASHGASGFDRLIFGSVAERVIRKAELPVLVVRAEDRSA